MSRVSAGAFAAAVMAFLASLPCGCSSGEKVYTAMRERMVREDIAARGISDRRVIEAMLSVPRHLFVPPDLKEMAYIDSPLPIGEEQTISQPYIVALMTESLHLGEGSRVLEIGTGSGYQAAVLAKIADSVYTIEIIPELAERAAALLDSLGFGNVEVRSGDGYFGWPEKAPFDGIIVTAAAPEVPPLLVGQLAEGGRLVIPVGKRSQELHTYEKGSSGLELISSVAVRFVPMTGEIRNR
jgi:protein-L-isoaspartate(D-aspartate) O-methyltransferase